MVSRGLSCQPQCMRSGNKNSSIFKELLYAIGMPSEQCCFSSTFVMGGWEALASKSNSGRRVTSAAFSNKMYVGSWPMPPIDRCIHKG